MLRGNLSPGVIDGVYRKKILSITWNHPLKRFSDLVLATEASVRRLLLAVDGKTSLTITLVMNALTIQIKGRQLATTHQLEYA